MARGRTAMTFEQKVEHALTSEITTTQKAFATWLEETTGADIDITTLSLVQRLYPEYIKTPEAIAAAEERKAKAEINKAESEKKALDAFMKRAEKLGLSVTKVEEADAE